jgi:alpha-N-arabinofuranosidase
MQPIMAVWAGFALGGTSVAEDQLGPYIQQAIDQINFVVGDPAKSDAAALRASLGHPEPFKLNFVEVGNEDFFAATSYVYRWHDFVTALQAEFPDIHFIATSDTFNPILSPNPTEYDVHVYQTPTWFAQNSFFYDDFERNGTKYFEGEYAAISTNPNDIFGPPSDGRLTFPTMQSAAGEAAFMTGLERNSDIVFAASYAPLLGHVTNNQWTPNLLAFDAGNVYRSTSYYVQKLFSVNRGDEYLPSTLPSRTGTLFWSVARKTSTQEIIIKISNTAATAAPITFALPFKNVATSGSAQILTGNATASNTPTNPTLFAPVTSKITAGKTFNFTAPPVSVSVLTIKAH